MSFRRLRAVSGFTLIELLVVILVIAILMAVAAPSFLGQTKKAQNSGSKQTLMLSYRVAKADTVDREGAWGSPANLVDAIVASEPELNVHSASGAPATAKTDGKTNVNLTVSGGTLTLVSLSESGDVCTLTVEQNGAISPPSCEPVPEAGWVFVRQLTSDESTNSCPAFSPDGDTIAYLSSADESIYLIPATGGTPEPLLESGSSNGCPLWSPDGTQIAYARQGSTHTRIYVADVSAKTATRLTDGDYDRLPAWSPDGTQIAYTGHTAFEGYLYLVSVPGGVSTQLTNEAGYADEGATWSPDGVTNGGTIAFSRGDLSAPAEDHLYELTLDEVDPAQITDGPYDFSPIWSPDGDNIAYLKSPSGPSPGLYVVQPGGGPSTQYVDAADIGGPAWSPNSSMIAYERDGWVRVSTGPGSSEAPLPTISGAQDTYNPSWSPDSTQVVYSAEDADGNDQICITELH